MPVVDSVADPEADPEPPVDHADADVRHFKLNHIDLNATKCLSKARRED